MSNKWGEKLCPKNLYYFQNHGAQFLIIQLKQPQHWLINIKQIIRYNQGFTLVKVVKIFQLRRLWNMLVDILSVQIFQIEVFIKIYIDFQNHSKKNGLPWMLAKGQDNFSTISQFIEKDIDPYSVDLQISVNGIIRQQDSAGKMHFKID